MARVNSSGNESVHSIHNWLGVNENPDGDTNLKMGEAAEMRNFRITNEGSLQKRPGTKTLLTIAAAPVKTLWTGYVTGTERVVAACNDKIWSLNLSTNTATEIGAFTTSGTVSFFGFSSKLYMMNGSQYKVWDGTTLSDVSGYRPLIAVSVPYSGGGTALQRINMLNGLRRVRFSPDGTHATFTLPEKGLTSVDYAKYVATDAAIGISSSDLVNGTTTLSVTPAVGTNTIEIGYTYPTTYRSQITAMKYAELYNGATDNRIFIYGDGSNKAYYSDLDYNGAATAEYFPDLNVVNIGDSNTPVTGMVRHYNQLMAFKTDSAYSIQYGDITLTSGSVTAAFYCMAVNKGIGNDAYGQVQTVVNYPRTLDGQSLYEWRPTSSTGNVTSDQRNANRISDRIENTLSSFSLQDSYAFVDKYNHEYYLINNGTALVHNYAADAWYEYTEFAFNVLLSYNGALYGGTTDGKIKHISRAYHNDDGAAIDCYWRSGSMTFGADFMRKYSSLLFVALKPELFAAVNVTIRTNVKSDFDEKTIAYSLATFKHANFAHWSFGTNRQPQTKKIRLKAKKFAYYQFIFSSNTDWSAATILSADFKMRFMGDIK